MCAGEVKSEPQTQGDPRSFQAFCFFFPGILIISNSKRLKVFQFKILKNKKTKTQLVSQRTRIKTQTEEWVRQGGAAHL